MNSLKPGSKIYFIALAGTGMSALAGLFKERGYVVAGSDIACYPPVSDLLAKLKIPICLSYDVADLQKFNPDYVVIGNFVRRDNPQAQYVLHNSIAHGSMPSTLETEFLSKTYNIVVAGTHGKSTTTTAIAHLLSEAGRDPSYFVGAVSTNLQKSFHAGAGAEFILEGDEYDTAFFDKESKFLHYRPACLVWTSLEFDHADIFPSMERLEEMFRKLLALIPSTGCLIYCRDWERVHAMVQESSLSCKKISYGFHADSRWRIGEKLQIRNGRMIWTLGNQTLESSMTGNFNAQNLSAATLAALERGIAWPIIEKAIQNFKGLKRRQELRIEKNRVRVIDDFAHHPTAVRLVLASLREQYPKERLVVFFEARSNTTRRHFFQKEFVEAFALADQVYLPEVFKKETLPESERLDVLRLVEDLRAKGVSADGPLSMDALVSSAQREIKKGHCTLVVLSNGSFDGLHDQLISFVKSQ